MLYTKSTQCVQEAWDLTKHALRSDTVRDWSDASKALVQFCAGARYALMSDLNLPDSVRQSYRRAVLSFEMDAKTYTLFFKCLSDAFYDYCHDSIRTYTWAEFFPLIRFERGSCDSRTWNTLKSATRSIFDHASGSNPEKHSLVSQWVNFDVKITVDDPSIVEAALVDYIKAEEEMEWWVYPDLSEYSEIIAEWFSTYDRTYAVPRHGRGATYETGKNARIHTKYAKMRLPWDLEQHLRNEWGLPLPHAWSCDAYDCRRSRLICVPKTATKRRTISAEPAALQWAQQGVRRAMVHSIESAPSCRVYLRNQEFSQAFALKGSICGEYATVDLSAASDSVTVDLVSRLFAGVPDLRDDLLLTRSYETELENGVVVPLSKFAPMGSATCFPVESVVFACICEKVIRSRRKDHSPSHYRDYVVYGDDIVIRESYLPDLERELSALHFKVNRKKTFGGYSVTPFREACGIEALEGQDVTPLRLSRRLCIEGTGTISCSPGVLSAWTDLANRAYMYSYANLRELALRMIKQSLGRRFFEIQRLHLDQIEGNEVGVYLLTDEVYATNYAINHRYNEHLWRPEWKSLITLRSGSQSSKSSIFEYFDWFLSHRWQALKPSDALNEEHDELIDPYSPENRSIQMRFSKRWHG